MLVSSCEEPSDWSTLSNETPTLVVEALITNELRTQEVQLSYSINDLNEQPVPEENALVTVETANNSFQFTHVQNGLYQSTIPFIASQDIAHQLTVLVGSEIFEATSIDAAVSPLPTFEHTQCGRDSSLFRMKDDLPLYSELEQSMYQFDYDWRSVSGDSVDIARVYEYTFNDLHINEVIPPPKDVLCFPSGTQLIVRKYGLNDEYADFLMSTLISTEWNGNIFYSSSSSPTSNISNGGLGFFTVARVLKDTLVL